MHMYMWVYRALLRMHIVESKTPEYLLVQCIHPPPEHHRFLADPHHHHLLHTKSSSIIMLFIHHHHYIMTTYTPLSNTSLREIPSPVFPDHHRHCHEHSDPSYYARSATGRSNSSFPGWNSSPPLPSAAIRPLEFSDGSKQVGAARSAGGPFVATTAVAATTTAGKPPPPPSSSPCYGSSPPGLLARPKLTTTAWEDEGTLCYQVDAKGICVARRADNQMVNGTKLLNVVGMSRGKRDGILKNERGRVVIKVGAMHLKGVWISLHRAKFLANKFRIADLIYPLFEDNPRNFVYHPTAASSPPIIADRPASMFEADTRSSPFIANKRSSLPSILDTTASRPLLHADSKSFSDSNRSPTSILPLPRALQQQTNFPCLNYNYQEQRQPPISQHMEQQSTTLRALPDPATTTGIQQPATSTMSHDQSKTSVMVSNDNLPKDAVQPSTCGNERERRSYGDA
ncbi:apses transcription factor [Lichtheimia corymbifera JMRC:FSU:9682]|uniref:Apses transcription factor n=1 Tax=Lichtheimia corymbifera JMRC:FSU:9682 TaxID=1263082 RepID=A0A068RVD3_9FUNG|nr:apses transcription factor [Lichtheimia corymbifera JMRC:FSU:9682]